jgi:hypothetical protein
MIRAEYTFSPTNHPTLKDICPLYNSLKGLLSLVIALDNVSQKGIEKSIERCE